MGRKRNTKIQAIIFALFICAFQLMADARLLYAAPAVGGAAGAVTGTAEETSTITLDFKEADIGTVLRVLSIKSHVNIVAGPEVQGTVTIRLENVPWEKALDVVLRTYDYVYERDGNIIRVTSREKMAQEPVITQTFVLNYTRASEVLVAVQDMLTERGRIQTAERTNTLVITDIPTNLYRMGQVLDKLDRITPQAYIDSKIVNTDLQNAENLGIEWQTGGTANNLGSLTGSARPTTFPFESDLQNRGPIGKLTDFFPFNVNGSNVTVNGTDSRSFPNNSIESTTGTGFQFGTLSFASFGAILQMLRTRSDTKVVSNPRIVVLNNQTARVQVGADIPLPSFERNETTGSVEVTGFTFREVGVVLNVTPHINSEEEILVELHPEVSSQGAIINFGNFQIPSFNVTRAITQVLIRSGETIAIGGLLTDNVVTTEAKVPYLSGIPILGKLFRSKRQTPGTGNSKAETLFFVTVTTVDTEGQPTGENAADRRKRQQQEAAEREEELARSEIKTDAETEADVEIAAAEDEQSETAPPNDEFMNREPVSEEASAA